jgi:hypothetical protein
MARLRGLVVSYSGPTDEVDLLDHTSSVRAICRSSSIVRTSASSYPNPLTNASGRSNGQDERRHGKKSPCPHSTDPLERRLFFLLQAIPTSRQKTTVAKGKGKGKKTRFEADLEHGGGTQDLLHVSGVILHEAELRKYNKVEEPMAAMRWTKKWDGGLLLSCQGGWRMCAVHT